MALARLAVHQDRLDRARERAALPGGVSVEHRRDVGDVARARVARDEALDELLRDERADVRVHERVVERHREILLGALARRHREAVEQHLLTGGVVLGVGRHRREVVFALGPGEVVDVPEVPARERVREALDDGLVVGRQRHAVGAELRRAVGVQLLEPDREQLQQLPGEVLVGADVALGIGAPVALHGQVLAHDGVQRHLLEQGAVVAEGVPDEDVVVVREPLLLGAEPALAPRHDEDLGQREGHALAQLVVGLDGHAPPLVDLLVPASGVPAAHARQHQRGGHRHLCVDPRVRPRRGGGVDVLERRAVARLSQQAEGLLPRGGPRDDRVGDLVGGQRGGEPGRAGRNARAGVGAVALGPPAAARQHERESARERARERLRPRRRSDHRPARALLR